MNTFDIKSLTDPDDNPFDRQERIDWWSQERLRQARFLVIGAGAIGNETLKNLALLGARQILIADFDTVSRSNLSRTILFRPEDVGQVKAEVAAKRTRELCLADDVSIDWFHGDVGWELGTGIYRSVDVVLGCLDNVETRFVVNRHCWLAGTPWIDAGIQELNWHVAVYNPPHSPCYECHMSEQQLRAVRQRYSCDDFKRSMVQAGKVPTVQVASALASAIQVQEAMKLICGQPTAAGKLISYLGRINDFDANPLTLRTDCEAHLSYPTVTALPLSNRHSLCTFLQTVSQPSYAGEGAMLDLNGYRWSFVAHAGCRHCGRPIEFFRPTFRIYDYEAICDSCREGGMDENLDSKMDNEDNPTQRLDLTEFDLATSPDRVLQMSLQELGIPYAAILSVRDPAGRYHYYELNADRLHIMPSLLRSSSTLSFNPFRR